MDKLTAIVGIDPGISGSLCLLIPNTKQVLFNSTTEKPIILLNWFNQIQKEFNLKIVMVEDVHAIPGAAAGSSFSFGWNTAVMNVIPLCSGASLDKVQPKVWQKYVGVKKKVQKKGAPKIKAHVRTRQLKQEVAAICDRLYPNVNIRGPKGGLLDGMSDALMIAHYASHIYK